MNQWNRLRHSIRHKKRLNSVWVSVVETTNKIEDDNSDFQNNPLSLINEKTNYDNPADNFWNIGGYEIAIERFKNGHQLGKDLKDCIKERAKIEADYAECLTNWKLNWDRYLIKKSFEYGTSKQAWHAFLQTGDDLASIHSKLAENFNKPIENIKTWIKKTYDKHIIHFNTAKKLEKDFEKAQELWKNCLDSIKDIQKEYDSICKKLNSTNFKDTPEHKEALRLEKYGIDEEKHAESVKESYERRINEVFEETQFIEKERIEMFEGIYKLCHDSLFNELNSNDLNYKQIFEKFSKTINRINKENDVKLWAQKYAIGMSFIMPKFNKH